MPRPTSAQSPRLEICGSAAILPAFFRHQVPTPQSDPIGPRSTFNR